MIWSFSRADQMIGYNFTDDVAITFALTKKRAIKKFSQWYAEVSPKEATCQLKKLLKFDGVAVLTDY